MTYFLILVNHFILLAFGSGKLFSEQISNLIFGNLIILGVFLLVGINMLVLVVEMVTNFVSLFRKKKKEEMIKSENNFAKKSVDKKNLVKLRGETTNELNSEMRGIMGIVGGETSLRNIRTGKFKRKMKPLGNPTIFKRNKNLVKSQKSAFNLDNNDKNDSKLHK